MSSEHDFSSDEENDVDLLFDCAADYVQHEHKRFSQTQLLELYAFYKQATIGDCNIEKPGFFQASQRAKWQAWQNLAGMGKATAKHKYVEKIKTLSPTWHDSVQEKLQEKSSRNANIGWVVHSTLQNTQEEIHEKSIFDWVREGDLSALKAHMRSEEVEESLKELDEHGMGLVHWATDRNQAELLEFLLESGADVNLRDSEEQTPLHYAASCGHVECLRVLLAHGADCHACDEEGKSCLDVAENQEIQKLLNEHQ